MAYLGELLGTRLERVHSNIWASVVSCALDLHATELVVEEMSGWACFQEGYPGRSTSSVGPDPFDWPEPYVREGRKVGRNAPCPCGSGKKHKKCCLRTGSADGARRREPATAAPSCFA